MGDNAAFCRREAWFGGFQHGGKLVTCEIAVLRGVEQVLQGFLVCALKSFHGSLFLSFFLFFLFFLVLLF